MSHINGPDLYFTYRDDRPKLCHELYGMPSDESEVLLEAMTRRFERSEPGAYCFCIKTTGEYSQLDRVKRERGGLYADSGLDELQILDFALGVPSIRNLTDGQRRWVEVYQIAFAITSEMRRLCNELGGGPALSVINREELLAHLDEVRVLPGEFDNSAYQSDHDALWGWAERIDKWMMEGTLPNRHLQGIFKPDRLADEAITRLSDKHPQAFNLIQADLTDVQAAFDGQDSSEDRQEELLAGMTRLRDRIRTVANMVADGESDEADGQQNDGKTVAQGGMAWQDAMKRAEEHVKAHDGAFPSVKRLAEIVGCSRPTIDKAILNSRYLKARQAEKAKAVRTEPLTDIAIEDASEKASKQDELAKLIDEQKAENARDERQAKAAKRRRD